MKRKNLVDKFGDFMDGLVQLMIDVLVVVSLAFAGGLLVLLLLSPPAEAGWSCTDNGNGIESCRNTETGETKRGTDNGNGIVSWDNSIDGNDVRCVDNGNGITSCN